MNPQGLDGVFYRVDTEKVWMKRRFWTRLSPAVQQPTTPKPRLCRSCLARGNDPPEIEFRMRVGPYSRILRRRWSALLAQLCSSDCHDF